MPTLVPDSVPGHSAGEAAEHLLKREGLPLDAFETEKTVTAEVSEEASALAEFFRKRVTTVSDTD